MASIHTNKNIETRKIVSDYTLTYLGNRVSYTFFFELDNLSVYKPNKKNEF